ncbi:MAG: tRNA 2-thiouridine(34) synthase MnmA [Rikenellaceae bacterium]
MTKEKVYIGVSGGVDSAAAVLILKNKGYDVVGVYIDMLGDENNDIDILKERLDVEIIVVNAHEEFERQVVSPFVEAYVNGETPSPCSVCNPLIKWDILIKTANKYSGESAKVATGHYAQVVERDSLLYIAKAKDELKNQSYYLWRLSQDVLKRALFPLGSYLKSELKEMMSAKGYDFVAKKKESMGVCFLKGKSYQEFLLNRVPELNNLEGGELLSADNTVIGHHKGYPFYTLAQRKGLPIEKGKCVVKIDKDANRLFVGTPEDLKTRNLIVKDYKIVNKKEFFSSDKLSLCVRGIGENPQGYCKVELIENDQKLSIEILDDDAWAVTAGQPVVFYIDNVVVGGAICC